MILKYSRLLYGLIFTTIIFNLFIVTNYNFLYIREIFTTFFLTIVPGFLILLLLKVKNISLLDVILIAVTLSLSCLILVGLSTNLLSSIINLPTPLTPINSLIVFDIYLLLLFIINLVLKNKNIIQFIIPKFNLFHFILYFISFLLPLMSILGAQLLNNDKSNTLTMIMLFLIGMFVLTTSLYRKKLEGFHYEIPIYFIATSLLLMFSMRSSYIIGWDIYQEYKVFLLTESNRLWSMEHFKDPYNACLSITILPVIFHYFTNIDTQSIFKILFQLLFSLVPVIIYSLTKNYTNRFYSFLSVFFFMSTSGYFLYMPSLIRQEVAFIFFSILLLIIFNKNLKSFQKNILFIILSTSIIVSHYSTTYLLIGLFFFTSIVLSLYNKVFSKYLHRPKVEYTIKPLLVIIFIGFSYLWFVNVTSISNNIHLTLKNTIENFAESDLMTPGTSIMDQINFPPKATNVQSLLEQDLTTISKIYEQQYLPYYPVITYIDYSPIITNYESLSLNINKNMSDFIYNLGFSITKIIKLLTVLGLIGMVYLLRKNIISLEYFVLSAGFVIAIIMITTIPVLSLHYPLNRLTQQALFLTAFPTILLLSWVLNYIKMKFVGFFIALTFVSYFLFNTSFIPQLIGGSDPQLHLNNTGVFYNEIYLHKSELSSIHWFSSVYDNKTPIFADIGSAEKIEGYSKIPWTYVGVFPSNIYTNGYVYSNYANTLYGIGIVNIRDKRMEYNFPQEFLNNNKDIIYNNGSTVLYK